jgi:hypothetical protein
MFGNVLFGLAHYFAKRLAESEEYQKGEIAFFEMPEVIRVFEQTLDILENGLGATRPNPEREQPAIGQLQVEEVKE